MIGVALFTVCTAAKATFHTDEANMSKNFAINTYIDAMTRGKANGMNEVLDPSVKFTMLRGKKVISFSKKEVLENLKNDKDVEQNCTTDTEILQNDADQSVVKVDMKYDGFVRSNYVTLANTGNGWKIINVYSVFK
jgi:uncharacterized protein YyaL (SSP411 family)